MNRDQPASDPFDLDARIDRLVDNDLAGPDRHALLLHLNANPDGWRRCALAFLEDQAWRTALVLTSATAHIQRTGTQRMPSRHNFVRQAARYALVAGLAAVFAGSCFWAGTQAANRRQPIELARDRDIPLPKQPVVASGDRTAPGEPLGWVDLVQSADADGPPQSVPILAATPATEQWLRDQPATMPEYVRAQWERNGFQVEESRRLVGLDLQDGRRVAIPVDEVAVDFVGRSSL